MNKIIEAFKEPKKRAFIQLGFYGVFFLFVFTMIGAGFSKSNYSEYVPINNNQEEQSISNFSYRIYFNDEVIEGTYYDGESTFTYKESNYYIEDNKVYVIDNDTYYSSDIQYNIKVLDVINLIRDLEEYSKTTYKDGRSVSTYIINCNEFYDYFDVEIDVEVLYDINIEVEKENDIIKSITLTNMDGASQIIKIEYSDINNIESLNFNKENYKYGE